MQIDFTVFLNLFCCLFKYSFYLWRMDDLQKRVRDKLLGRLMTQKKLAQEFDISEVTMSKILRGKQVSHKLLKLIDLSL